METIGILSALLAGALSFLSPCVLPLVPPYLCYVGGVGLRDIDGSTEISKDVYRHILKASLAFVLGFSTIFISLGMTASFLGQILLQNLSWLSQVAGVFIIVVGLHFLGVFKFAFLHKEFRISTGQGGGSLTGAYGMGLAFAFGWTPCIGPVLAAILGIASSQESVGHGGFLLAIYSLGLGVPFMLAALSVSSFLRFMNRFKAHMVWVERVMGMFLVITGMMFITGTFQTISYWLLETFPFLSLG